MKKWILLIAFFNLSHINKASGLSGNTIVPGEYTAAINPTNPDVTSIPLPAGWSTMRVKEIEKLTGKKFSLKEKIAWSLYRAKLKKLKGLDDKGDERLGRDAQMLGIFALISLFIPVIGLFCAIPLAIIAIIKGSKAKKINPDNRKAKTGIILGIITLALIAALVILVAAILSTGAWSFG